VAINLRRALQGLEERVEIVAFVLRGTPAETITLATQDIAAFPEVKEVVHVTEEQALARARRELVEFRDAYRDLQVNPLPASIEVRLRDGYRDAATVERVAQRLRVQSDDVRFGREWSRNRPTHNITGWPGDRARLCRGGRSSSRPSARMPSARGFHHGCSAATGSSARPPEGAQLLRLLSLASVTPATSSPGAAPARSRG
jgi:hypothetical protein